MLVSETMCCLFMYLCMSMEVDWDGSRTKAVGDALGDSHKGPLADHWKSIRQYSVLYHMQAQHTGRRPRP